MQAEGTPIEHETVPDCLLNITKPVGQLYRAGQALSTFTGPRVAIVGSRRATTYGKQVTLEFGRELAAAGVVIVSGLALGIDGIAHTAALEASGQTIAVLPCHPSRIYPASHLGLARRILAHGGALVSEYGPDEEVAYKYNFVERNRIIAGLSDAVLITEAAEGSGSIHTADFALDQGKTVFVVPGSIYNPFSVGTNTLITSGRALPVTSAADILFALGYTPVSEHRVHHGDTPEQQSLLDLLSRGVHDGRQLLEESRLPVALYSQTLTMLEITGKVRALGNNHWATM